MTEATRTRGAFLSRFEEQRRKLARRGPVWLRERRKAAMARFDELGLPTSRDEQWRHTNLTPLTRTVFHPGARGEPPRGDLNMNALADLRLGGPRLVFVDGKRSAALSSTDGLCEGVRVMSLAEALEQIPERLEASLVREHETPDGVFEALNSALLEDGAVVVVPDGVRLDAPIQLCFVSGGADEATASHPLTLLLAGQSSQVRLVEQYVGIDGSTYFTNARTSVEVGDNAIVDHYRLQLESDQAFHVSSLRSRQARDSRYTSHNVNLGGRLVRHDVRAALEGEGGTCQLYGLYLTRESQHVDNHTVLDHTSPHCDSRELYKGILDGKSSSVFCGRIVVRPGAQKTDAKQSNPNLLLSKSALAHTQPQLEIYADDVKCTHGATVGQIDADAVFYLRSRGLPEAQARDLLVNAFAGELLEHVQIESLRVALGSAIADWLTGGKG
jgi:Fe-S cluster assembly protein SufD